VVVPLKRPVVSKVGLFQDWPLILIDLYTKEGVVGHSYLEPYIKQSARYIVPAIEDLAEAAKGQPVAPFDGYRRGVGSLHLVGREGVSLIAVSGLDMAAGCLGQSCRHAARRVPRRDGRSGPRLQQQRAMVDAGGQAGS
jgi:mandelate racemase